MLIVLSCVLCLLLLASLYLLVRKLTFTGQSLPVTAEWIGELSIERYRPMMRLLDGSDLSFLRSQPGFTPGMAVKLRIQRCQMFRGYLRCLKSDFRLVCTAIKLVMLQSRHDRPDLALALIRHQWTFAAGMLMVHCRLSLYRWGVCGVDVSWLVESFETMRRELRSIVPATDLMGA